MSGFVELGLPQLMSVEVHRGPEDDAARPDQTSEQPARADGSAFSTQELLAILQRLDKGGALARALDELSPAAKPGDDTACPPRDLGPLNDIGPSAVPSSVAPSKGSDARPATDHPSLSADPLGLSLKQLMNIDVKQGGPEHDRSGQAEPSLSDDPLGLSLKQLMRIEVKPGGPGHDRSGQADEPFDTASVGTTGYAATRPPHGPPASARGKSDDKGVGKFDNDSPGKSAANQNANAARTEILPAAANLAALVTAEDVFGRPHDFGPPGHADKAPAWEMMVGPASGGLSPSPVSLPPIGRPFGPPGHDPARFGDEKPAAIDRGGGSKAHGADGNDIAEPGDGDLGQLSAAAMTTADKTPPGHMKAGKTKATPPGHASDDAGVPTMPKGGKAVGPGKASKAGPADEASKTDARDDGPDHLVLVWKAIGSNGEKSFVESFGSEQTENVLALHDVLDAAEAEVLSCLCDTGSQHKGRQWAEAVAQSPEHESTHHLSGLWASLTLDTVAEVDPEIVV